MSRKPTQKQHAFALEYLETGKPSDSYRAAGYACDKMTPAEGRHDGAAGTPGLDGAGSMSAGPLSV